MSTPQLERLGTHCQRLRLHRVEAELSTLLEQAAKKDVSYADFLDDVLALELEAKQAKHRTMRVTMARFPFQKSLETFDSRAATSTKRLKSGAGSLRAGRTP